AERDVLVDRHGKRRRLLEHHANARAQKVEILLGGKNVLAVEQDVAFRALVGIKVVHPIENAQQRGLSAAGWTDEGGDPVFVERQADGFERFAGPVIEVEVSDRNLFVYAGRADRRVGDGGNGDRGGGDIHDGFLDVERARAVIESASTVKVMISAPVQASFCQSL